MRISRRSEITNFGPSAQTTVPRWKRCLAAFFELNLGLVYSPFVFLRAFFSLSSAGPKQARAPAHLGGIGADSCGVDFILWAIATFGLWKYFVLDVSRTRSFGGEFAELAQIHRACRNDGRHGKWHQLGASSRKAGWGGWLLSRCFTNRFMEFIINGPVCLIPFCPNTWKNCSRKNRASERPTQVIVTPCLS